MGNNVISLEGKLVRLRPIQKDDLDKSLVWKNDPIIRENILGYSFPITKEMEMKWYESLSNNRDKSIILFGIEAIDRSTLIGFIHLKDIDWISRVGQFGITIGDSKYWRKGIGFESMEIFHNYIFLNLNLRKVCLQVVSYNESALNLYRKFGFIEEGCLSKHIFIRGDYFDVISMRLFDFEYKSIYF